MQNVLFSGPWRPREASNHTSAYNQIHFLEGPGQLCFYKKSHYLLTPMSVRLCVCVSVRVSPRKSAATFEPMDGSAQTFQGPLNSLQVIFGRVSAKSISSGAFGARGSCCTFSESGQRGEQNVGSRVLSYGPRPEKTGPEGGAGRGADQILEF